MNLLEHYGPVDHEPRWRLLDFMRQLGDRDAIMLGAGIPDPDLLPRQAIVEAFQAADEASDGGFLGYQVPEGNPDLRERIAARLGERGVAGLNGGGSVLLTTGCTQALHLALSLHGGSGSLIACESPCYYHLLEQIHWMGARALPVPSDPSTGIRLDALEETIERHHPACLVLCSTLSNPTGATIPDTVRHSLVEMCRENGVHIIEDDIYAELHEGPEQPIPLRALDDGTSVTLVSSFSKTISPGLRVGFMVPGPHFDEVANHRCMMDMHGSTSSEATILAYLQRADANGYLEGFRTTVRRRRNHLIHAVESIFPEGTRVTHPEGGFLIWVTLDGALDLPLLAERALAEGVTVAIGNVFLPGQPLRGCMRLNAARASEADMTRGVEILGRIIADMTRAHPEPS